MSKHQLTKVDDPEYPYRDARGVAYESPRQYLWTEVLGGCGCGSSDFNEELAMELLEYFATPHMERDFDFIDRPEVEILAHWMDSVGLLEHGGSIVGSWLSEEGEEVHEALSSNNGTKVSSESEAISNPEEQSN